MTTPMEASASRPLQRQAILSATVCSAMFLFGWAWFFGGLALKWHEKILFGGLAVIALVQMASGFWAFIAAIRARHVEGMAGALTATGVITGFLFGVLGLLGLPLFVGFMSGMGVGISG